MSSSGILKAGHFFRKLKFGAQRARVPHKFASVEIRVRLFVAQRRLATSVSGQLTIGSFIPGFQKGDDFKYITTKA